MERRRGTYSKTEGYRGEEEAQSRAEERKAVKIGRILQSYGHTQRDETKERRDGWNCT